MNGFLEALGKRIAEHWLSLVVLPGVLWVAAALVAARLGWHDALSVPVLLDGVTRWAGATRGGALVLVVTGLLAAAAAAGLAATGLGALARRLWVTRGRRRPIRWLTGARRRRWLAADAEVRSLLAEAVRDAPDPAGSPDSTETQVVPSGPEVAEALARRDAVSLEPPERPTWIGDRWLAGAVRVHRAYGLDLAVAWPRLWTVLPEPLRADVAAAQAAYTAASTLVGWAVLYGVLSVWWWPGLVVAAATAVTSVVRARTAANTLCLLVETAADLHGPALADQLRTPCPGPLTFAAGSAITERLRKDRE